MTQVQPQGDGIEDQGLQPAPIRRPVCLSAGHRLRRDVVWKVLPGAFASDPGRMMRFQREAEVLASLNHHNIAQIYGVEERALVMEFVEGERTREAVSTVA